MKQILLDPVSNHRTGAKLGARYYDGHGHFTQPDPIVPGGGDYRYTDGDPINRSDPTGLFWGKDQLKGMKGALNAYSVISGVGLAVDVYGDFKAGDAENAWAKIGGAAASVAYTAGCGAMVGGSGVGLVYCAGTSAIVGAQTRNMIRGYDYEK